MKKGFGWQAAVAIVLFAATAPAQAIELVQPAPNAILRGGSFAQLQCSLLAAPAGAEEWEAFLSIDGGAHYDVRLTPHLNLSIDRYAWLVPNVDASDARILIRTGDERHETIVEIPQSFSIRRDAQAQIHPPSWIVREQAEAARPGDAPVAAWAEGDRAGSGGTVAAWIASDKGWSAGIPRSAPSLTVDATPSSALAPSRSARSLPFRLPPTERPHIAAAFVPLDILLTCRRLNI